MRITSSPYGLNELGYTCATMMVTESYTREQFGVNLEKSSCSDYRLQFVYTKVESQVIVNQHDTVNLCLDLAHTARHMLGVSFV